MRQHLILATMIAISAISCSKSHENAPPEIKEYFRGKVDGILFSDSTTARIVIYRPGGLFQPPPVPSIQGQCPVGRITLDFLNWPDTGERMLGYPLGDRITITTGSGQPFFAGRRDAPGGIEVWQGSGKITMLEITGPYMKGTFECIAPADSTIGIFPPISITEGEFNLKIPQ